MKKIWAAVASALVLLGIAFLILGLVNPTPPSVPVRAGEFEDSIPQERVQELISSALPKGVQIAGAKAPFKVTHQSPEQTADFSFNALGSIWEVDLPKGDKVTFEVRFKEERGGWSEWREIEEEDDLKEDPPPGTHYGRLISAGDARQFQYRAIFTLRSAKQVPSVPKIKLTYIDSRGKAKARGRSIGTILRDAVLAVRSSSASGGLESVLLRKMRSFLEFGSYEVSADAPSDDISVISRADWGVKESYRLDKNGNEIWTRSYRPVEKVIVHHTVFNDPDPKVAVRAIYYYHGVTLGWGDIGYNFLIDQNGNIYEGRYGGDGVVAGHARRYNWGSVGVSVLGDFRYDKVNNPIRNALDKIAVWKFTKHRVDSTLNTHFIDRKLPSVFGHGEVLATLCPGTNLQSYVPKTREHAHFMPQKVLVKFKSGVSDGQINGFAGRLGLTEVSNHRGNVKRFRFDNTHIVEEMIVAAEGESIVAYARANHIRGVTVTPNDPRFPEQWSLPQIKAPEAWDISPGGDSSVTVAVVDTGVAYESYSDAKGTYAQATDFEGTTFVPGYDTINDDAHANDDHGHGTAVASIIAATTNNSYGIAGIAYAVKIMPIKVLGRYGYGTDVTVADGIYWAVDNGAKVLNLSLGGWYSSPILEEAVEYAVWGKGAVIVAAAGNSGQGQLLYPARYADVIAVGASDLAGNRTWYSNYGEGLDLFAPGGDTTADLDENGIEDGILYETLDIKGSKNFTKFKFDLGQGTSFAAPHVSAVAALLAAEGITIPYHVRSSLRVSLEDGALSAVGSLNMTPGFVLDGWGRIHQVGSTASLSVKSYWNGWDIARDFVLNSSGTGGYILDGWGGIHPFGDAPKLERSVYWGGWDIARAIVLLPDDSGGYVLDGWGGIHPFGDALELEGTVYWQGWDIARDIVLTPDGKGGYVLDGWGGIHPFGNAVQTSVATYWRGWDIANAIAILPDGSGGYVLDGWGGIHPFGSALPLPASVYWRGWDIARDIVLNDSGTGGHVLDGWGGIHPFGSAVQTSLATYWRGWDIANRIILK